MLTSLVFCSFLIFSLTIARPWYENYINDEDDEEDIGVIEALSGFGEKLFSTPTNSSGKAVSNWKPSSNHNPEELGEYAEGDILFPAVRARNGLAATSARWPNKTVPYVISGYFSSQEVAIIRSSIQGYHKNTCVRFVPHTSERDYLDFTSGPTGCWSSVGRTGGRQEINLQSPGCLTKQGTVMHEMMHALGFLHEQNRWERDQYVFINYQNIEPGRVSNFEKAKKADTDALGIPYDYGSVMHYSENAFSVNGRPTIVPKQSGVQLGQRDFLSKQDIKKIRRMYRCKKIH